MTPVPEKYKGRYKKKQAEYYQADKERYRWNAVRSAYGIEKEDYYNLLDKQDNKCALCETDFARKASGRGPQIDHDHVTNKVRGLLCMPCNVALGMLGDNAEGLTKALKYVRGE